MGQYGIFRSMNWTKRWQLIASRTHNSNNASKRQRCTSLRQMPKPLSGWRLMALYNWNSWCVPFTYPKNHTTYVIEYSATHVLCYTLCGVADIVQEQQTVHGSLLHGNGTKRQGSQTLCTNLADMPATFSLCICVQSYRRIWHPAIYRSLCRHVLVQTDG